MAGERTENLLVLEKKIIWNITIIIGYCYNHIFYLYLFSMQKNAVKRYENQIITNAEVRKNIDYISSMIKSKRSVYINHQLMGF